jgi:glycosyltransferase involved in cell wall biosynthesis
LAKLKERQIVFAEGLVKMKLNLKVVHMTSVHDRTDTRIFHKECKSLVAEGYSVSLVVADGKGDSKEQGIEILDVGKGKGRFDRMSRVTRRVFQKALESGADIYHFHDPELLPYGWLLKKKGKKVIYDIHEDVPRQILSKPWIPGPLRALVAKITEVVENTLVRSLDGLVCATPKIAERFQKKHRNVVTVCNYPILSELHDANADWSKKEKAVCYVGGISRIRGIREMVAAAEHIDGVLYLAGPFDSQTEFEYVSSLPGWKNVRYLGVLDRSGVRDLLNRVMAGLVLFLPEPNHIEAQPNKMFEYMSAGIPVIASDFPLWRDIIEGCGCGVCADPSDPVSVASKVNSMIGNAKEACMMGQRGRVAVREKFSWEMELGKLKAMYEELR